MIGEDERLLRRVHPALISDGRLTSAAFRFANGEMSVDREALAPLMVLKERHPDRSFARLLVSDCTSLGCAVVEAPLVENRAHANVLGPPEYGRRELERLSRSLRDLAQFPAG